MCFVCNILCPPVKITPDWGTVRRIRRCLLDSLCVFSLQFYGCHPMDTAAIESQGDPAVMAVSRVLPLCPAQPCMSWLPHRITDMLIPHRRAQRPPPRHFKSPSSIAPKQCHSHRSSASIYSSLSWGASAGLWALAGDIFVSHNHPPPRSWGKHIHIDLFLKEISSWGKTVSLGGNNLEAKLPLSGGPIILNCNFFFFTVLSLFQNDPICYCLFPISIPRLYGACWGQGPCLFKKVSSLFPVPSTVSDINLWMKKGVNLLYFLCFIWVTHFSTVTSFNHEEQCSYFDLR